ANTFSTLYWVGGVYILWMILSLLLAVTKARKTEPGGEIATNPLILLVVALVVDFGAYTWLKKPDFGPLKIVTMTNNSLAPLLYNREQLVIKTNADVERGDLVAVYYPKPFFALSVDVDRVIGLPGEMVELRDNLCYVEGTLTEPFSKLQYSITIYSEGGTEIDYSFWQKYGLDGAGPRPGGYIITTTEAVAQKIVEENAWALRYETRKADPNRVNDRLFAGAVPGWNENQMGPFKVPQAGQTIPLDSVNRRLYKRNILLEDSNVVWTDSAVLRNGKPILEYTFQEDAYWLMADSRDNGFDSRLWGFVPASFLIGKAMYIWQGFEDDRRGNSLLLD
ncbi:MAG: S26 family signal peptidase, partial [Bacteroidota bacterium]